MKEEYLAYFKYSGENIEEGYLDLRKSAESLLGLDELFRYFLYKKDPELSKIDFEIPVRIRKGSWEALIPENIGEWLAFAAGSGLTTYTITALKEMAKNDVGDKGFKTIFKQIVKSIKWAINIAKHIGTTKQRQFTDTQFKEINGVQFVGIPNAEGEILFVPSYYLELFSEIPPNLFAEIAKPIELGREFYMDFSATEKNDKDDSGEASISYNDKTIFYQAQEPDDILFPELKHDQYAELEGHVTRGNESSNRIGFRYNDHILTCYPESGNIKKYKTLLILKQKLFQIMY